MAVGDEGRALLRLLLSGEDYESIAGLMGVSASEVRLRAHGAIAEAGPLEPGLADAARTRIAELDGEPRAQPAQPTQPSPGRRVPVWAPIAAGAVVLAAILLIVLGGGGEDGGSSQPSTEQEQLGEEIPLHPTSEPGARGIARIISIADLPALDLAVSGLPPSAPDETYIVWLYNSPSEAFPVLFQNVAENGRLEGRGVIPAAATALLPQFDALDISLADKKEAVGIVDRAAAEGEIPRHVGRSVLRGTFPRSG